jgi:hypothetical protein
MTKWKRNGCLPLGWNTTFAEEFLCWPCKSYGAWSGLDLKNGQSMGAFGHQTTKTHPITILVLSLNKTLGYFSYAVDGMDARRLT